MTTNHLTGKNFLLVLLLILSLPLFNSCDKNNEDEPKEKDGIMLWDFYGLSIPVAIHDADGTNLLSPSAPGSLYGTDISIEWEGKNYSVQWTHSYLAPGHDADSRTYVPSFYGLRFNEWQTNTEDGVVTDPDKSYLSFGEFESAANYDMTFTLRIEDRPETYRFEVSQRFEWKNGDPMMSTVIRLNGQEVTGMPTITL